MLPELNGIDFCKQIRLIKPHIPIIMLTALGTTDDKVEGFDAGADDYLVKPFEMRELIVRIRALLKRAPKNYETDFFLKYAVNDKTVAQVSKEQLRALLSILVVAIVGLVPAAISSGIGSDVQRPLLTVIIGGLTSTLIFAPILIPTLYLWLGKRK